MTRPERSAGSLSDQRRAARTLLAAHGQEHVLRFCDQLSPAAEEAFLEQLLAQDLPRLTRLIQQVLQPTPAHATARIEPPELIAWGEGAEELRRDATARQAGEEALAAGHVAAFLVAGGQGTRLGYDGPKGRYPVGPITQRSLFAYHAQRILATSRRYGHAAPLYVLTSASNHESTVGAFEEAEHFGLDPQDVHFLVQGMLPAIDRAGKLLLAHAGSLALSPDGHGGALRALARGGALEDMERRGIREIFSFQVDNPLCRVLDPVFIGHHVQARAEMSTKVVAKRDAAEKVGVLARLNGRLGVVEYSDLDPALAAARQPDGQLLYRAGNIAIHLLRLDFVRRLTSGTLELPVHRADKAVPCLDAEGQLVRPSAPNAIKMEQFLFDALPLAAHSITQEVARRDEFAPVKNAEGVDSPESARAALSDQARRWMAAAGLALPPGPAEVGPLFALDQEEFLANLTRSHFGPVFDRS
ncbi:MAG: UTP--glucose-1-phosphate uridylyltransferase [Planctomycetota bacterium]